MPAANAVLTPFDRTAPRQSGGRRWAKRLLPVGEIDYKGRKLSFTRDYLSRLAEAFRQKAYDQVPFQLAPADNSHTNDVERFGGRVVTMNARPDGLWIELDATERGDRVLRENPDLGVSARIVEEYARSDGKWFPAAVQHVLGTLDPRIPGLGGWQAVEAANDADVTIDLSHLQFSDGNDEGTADMAPLPPEQQERLNQLLSLPDDQWRALMDGSAPLTDEELAALGAGDGDGGDGDGEDGELAAWIDTLSDEELAALEAEMEAGEGQAAEPAPAALSAEARQAIEMASVQSEEALGQLAQINAELDEQRYQTERRRFYDMGIPAAVVDKFAPLLKGTGHAVELANGQVVDAGQVAREGLAEYARMARLLDLSGEEGSVLDEPDGAAGSSERENLVSRAKAQMGLVR